MSVIQLTIHHFPKSKQKYHFESVGLIDRVFDTTSLDINLEEVECRVSNGWIYNNQYVTIKKISSQQGLRVCIPDGDSKDKPKRVKWITL